MWSMTKERLASLKAKALRRRVWYALSRIERSVLDLTIMYVDEIRSEKLSLVISRIVCKILNALRSPFLRRIEQVGYDLVATISEIAVRWGYVEAVAWKQDLSFVKYLGVKAINSGGRSVV